MGHSADGKIIPFDLVVIGGGINGAAIARDASMRGLSVALLEKHDFGYGASTKSSKLAHGGLRYLELWQFGLVRESLKERGLLLKNAPHLVHPLPFIFPVYKTDDRPLWQIHLGLYLYDFLGGSRAFPKHRKLSVEDVLTQFPGIKTEGLRGGCLYYDAQILDNRIVIENIISAERLGTVVYNHAEVTQLLIEEGCMRGVCFRQRETGATETIRCRSVVNATGAWSEQVAAMMPSLRSCRVAPTKGTHLIVPKITGESAMVLHAPQDKRVFFIIPWGEYSLVGTTDTFYSGKPEDVSVTREDCDYLMTAVNAYFPEQQLKSSSILSSFAGLRPLVAPARQTASPSDIVRGCVIETSCEGVTTILGGKYTTHRGIAESVVDDVISHLKEAAHYRPCSTATVPLPGAQDFHLLAKIKTKLQAIGLENLCIEHLLNTYGTASAIIAQMINEDSALGKKICDEHPHVLAELSYCVKYEHVKSIGDWLFRRSFIAYTPPCCGMKCLKVTADKLALLLGWDAERKSQEIESFEEAQGQMYKDF